MTAVALPLAGGRAAAATARATRSHRFEATAVAAVAAMGPRKLSSPWQSATYGPGPFPRMTSSSSAAAQPHSRSRSSSSSTETTSTATSSTEASGRAPIKRGTSLADSTEVEKFSSMADDWWDHRSNPLIGMNPTRVSRMVHVLKNRRRGSRGRRRRESKQSATQHRPDPLPLAGLRALDVGCGGGLLSESLARLGATVTAIDPSQEIVEAARRHSAEFLDEGASARIDYRGGVTVEDLADELVGPGWRDASEGTERDVGNVNVEDGDEGPFDVICILEVLEHAPDPARLLSAASALLKKRPPASAHGGDSDDSDSGGGGGTLFVSTINRTAKSYLLAVVGAEYVAGMLPPGTHDWNRFLSPGDVRGMARPLGLDCVDLCGMVPVVPELWPPPTPLSLASMLRWRTDEEDTDVNWIGAYAHR